jgi:hypothetical protein
MDMDAAQYRRCASLWVESNMMHEFLDCDHEGALVSGSRKFVSTKVPSATGEGGAR